MSLINVETLIAADHPTTDPEAKLMRKGPGKDARLCFGAHAMMENRNGLCVLFDVKPAVGAPESSVAVEQATELRNRGFERTHAQGQYVVATWNLVRTAKLFGSPPGNVRV